MAKTTVETVADNLGSLIKKQQDLVNQMRTRQIGRRRAYEVMKEIRTEINELVGRLGSM